MSRISTFFWAVGLLMAVVLSFNGCTDETPTQTWMVFGTEETGIAEFKEFTICPDVLGNVYALQQDPSSNQYRLYYRSADGQWTSKTIEHVSRNFEYIVDADRMKATDDGSVWLLGTDHLIRFRFGEVLRSYPLPGAPEVYQYTDFIPDLQGVWLLVYQAGLARMDLNTGMTASYLGPVQSAGFSRMSQDAEGNIWIARKTKDYNLIGRMADGSWQRPDDPDSLLAQPLNWPGWQPFYVDFTDAAIDENGNSIFLKDDIAFVYRVKQGRLQRMSTSAELSANVIKNDKQGRPWFIRSKVLDVPWDINPNLMRLENYNIAEKANLTDALPGSNIWPYDLAFDRNNNAWVATNKGVVVYNKDGIEF